MEASSISNSTVGVVATGQAHVTVGRDLNVYGSTQESFTKLTVPPVSQVFQGRQDYIKTLDSLYFTGEPRITKVVVCGSAGYGKTEFVKKYAHHAKTSGKIKKVFWVVAETTDNLEEKFESLKKAYETFIDELCLFVFDNGESRKHLNDYLPPDTPNALVLITSQVQDWGDDIVSVELKPVNRDTSLAIFKNILEYRFERISEERINEIIKFMDGIPLGLMVIAGDLRQEMDALGDKFDIQSYKKEICSQSTLDKTIDAATPSSYDKSLRTAIHSMMNRMIQRHSAMENNFTNKILCVCVHLNPDRISMDVVKAILSEVGVDDRTIARCAHKLKISSFISHEESTDGKSYYHIHRTCQDILRKYYDEKNKEMKDECYSACVRWELQKYPWYWSEHRAAIFMNADENKIVFNEILRDYYSFVNIFLPKCLKSSHRKYSTIKHMLQHLASYGCYDCLTLFFSDKYLITRNLILKKFELVRDGDGRTALHRAARFGSADTVRVLLQRDSDVHAMDKNGWTALHTAAWDGHTNTVRVLLQGGSDVHAVGGRGFTALHFAAWRGHIDTVRVLMKAGSDVHAVSNDGKTALHTATWVHGHTDTVPVLLQGGSDVHAVDVIGRTALHWAAWDGHADTVRILLQAGSDVHVVDKRGRTALHLAAMYGHTDAVRVLVEGGSDVHAVDEKAGTALHWAARRGNTDTEQLLLSYGASYEDGDMTTTA